MPAPPDKSAQSSLQDQAIAWLACLRDDSLSDAELEAFADWLSQDPLHAEAFTAVENLFREMVVVGSLSREAEAKQPVSRQAAPATFGAVRSKSSSPPLSTKLSHRPWFAFGFAIAATCLLVIGLIMPQQSRFLSDYLSDFRTQTGELREIELSDGSRLLMNTNSAVSVEFNPFARKIVLHHGQVRFTVAKDLARPFEVKADNLNIRALGTVFDVYESVDSQTNVIVQQHAVSVSRLTTPTDYVEIQEGQQISYQPGQSLPKPQAARLEQATAWQQHRLVINDRPLIELISELERYCLGRIFLADAALKNLRVTGVFRWITRNKPCAQSLRRCR